MAGEILQFGPPSHWHPATGECHRVEAETNRHGDDTGDLIPPHVGREADTEHGIQPIAEDVLQVHIADALAVLPAVDAEVLLQDSARDDLVADMGSKVEAVNSQPAKRSTQVRDTAELMVRAGDQQQLQGDSIELRAHKGEIVGLAGLAGHGQAQILLRIYDSAMKGKRTDSMEVKGPVALVAGDRQTDGIFHLWSIGKNVCVRSFRNMTKRFLIDPSLEQDMSEHWKDKIKIKTLDMNNNILSLSGGNQQKALFARALGSDAEIVLMDDPMRGVDIGTKFEVYELIKSESDNDRTFIWYTTEMDELKNCDHVYIFREGQIVAEIPHHELTEEKVIQASFDKGA